MARAYFIAQADTAHRDTGAHMCQAAEIADSPSITLNRPGLSGSRMRLSRSGT
jgi:hypothetical protein